MTAPVSPPRPVILPRPIGDSDPRLDSPPQALALASRNAYPLVAARPRRGDGLGLAAGIGVALLLGGVTFFSMSGHRAVPRAAPPPPVIAAVPVIAPPLPAPAPTTPFVGLNPAPMSLPANTLAQPTNDPARAPALVFDGSSGTATATAPGAAATTAPPVPGAKAAPAGATDNDQFASRIPGEGADVATATPLGDPASTVAQGTLIPAVLETAIDTDLPGYVRAVVSRDVRSFDSSRVLIPRSSRLIGQYKSGLAAGQTRAYVIWQRLIRPDGVSVALASPAVDFSGKTGLAGKVDGHFMKRFGSAVLLSVVGGLGALGSSGTSVVLSGGGQSAASVAASRDTAIPPTIRVAQGQPIRVFTARDLDFSAAPTDGDTPAVAQPG